MAIAAFLIKGHRRDQDFDFELRGIIIFSCQFLANFGVALTISWLMSSDYLGYIALVVIFPEIRIGLERLGRATGIFTMKVSPGRENGTGLCQGRNDLYEP